MLVTELKVYKVTVKRNVTAMLFQRRCVDVASYGSGSVPTQVILTVPIFVMQQHPNALRNCGVMLKETSAIHYVPESV